MKDGFIRMGAVTPAIHVADPCYNSSQVLEMMETAAKQQVKVLVFPELCLTGYTCSDLFLQTLLLQEARKALAELVSKSRYYDMVVILGLPWEKEARLYNVAAVFAKGQLLGLVPKSHMPNYGEFYELRHFSPGPREAEWVDFTDEEGQIHQVPFGTNILFSCENMAQLRIAVELCEDVWVPSPPSIRHALAGATVIANCSASNEATGKAQYRKDLIVGQSARLVCGYIYANAGEGESTTDLVFGGHNILAENGTLLVESPRFKAGMITSEMDVEKICNERRRMSSFGPMDADGYTEVYFTLEKVRYDNMRRFIDPAPFVPGSQKHRAARCEEIFSIQAMGLRKRLLHTKAPCAVVGLSGGLDSTLALLVMARAFDSVNLPRQQLIAVTMPCFGTTDRTYRNACTLAEKLGATLREVPIAEAVRLHFRDIGHIETNQDVTYENAQARERTQVLMDIANQTGGLVIGTGDMSELALGWATYNGDHMSMYGVNASVPKTLVRHLVQYYADTCADEELTAVLKDVLATPVSPELLPPQAGEIAQKTEDIVGPYELHDFFLYHVLRNGFPPSKIRRLAQRAFIGVYDAETIEKWLLVFYKRFFSQQFKRSCLPDGPKVGSVAVSPRGDLRMPSDASVALWLRDLEQRQTDE